MMLFTAPVTSPSLFFRYRTTRRQRLVGWLVRCWLKNSLRSPLLLSVTAINLNPDNSYGGPHKRLFPAVSATWRQGGGCWRQRTRVDRQRWYGGVSRSAPFFVVLKWVALIWLFPECISRQLLCRHLLSPPTYIDWQLSPRKMDIFPRLIIINIFKRTVKIAQPRIRWSHANLAKCGTTSLRSRHRWAVGLAVGEPTQSRDIFPRLLDSNHRNPAITSPLCVCSPPLRTPSGPRTLWHESEASSTVTASNNFFLTVIYINIIIIASTCGPPFFFFNLWTLMIEGALQGYY